MKKKFYIIIANMNSMNYKAFIERESSSNAHVIAYENEIHSIYSDMKGFIHIMELIKKNT